MADECWGITTLLPLNGGDMNMMLGTFGPLTPKKGQGPVNPIYGEAKPTGILKGGALNAGACPRARYLIISLPVGRIGME